MINRMRARHSCTRNSCGELALVTCISPSAALYDGQPPSISVSQAKPKQARRKRHGGYDFNNFPFLMLEE